MFNFPGISGKKVFLTGACGIFGKWMTEAFLREGATVGLSDVRQDLLDKRAEELALPQRPLLVPADLTSAESIEKMAQAVGEAWGAPDIVVNVAGVYQYDFLLDMDVKLWDRIMDVNLRAPFLVTREMAKLMIRNHVKGNIINISSGAARKMRTTSVPYCVSKAAQNRLTLGLALELAEYGIRVNAVEPGFAPGSEFNPTGSGHLEKTLSNIPLGRCSGPDDAPNAVLYLASDLASYITGTAIAVDGGNSIGNRTVFIDKKKPTSI